jgi:hypothetical protein
VLEQQNSHNNKFGARTPHSTTPQQSDNTTTLQHTTYNTTTRVGLPIASSLPLFLLLYLVFSVSPVFSLC